ncbi:MAG TPA: asparagine synthase-related protein [Candidatus Acidoferrales bacterium]|nr:asparagine synthase-related protein [Candidatus Acidoferrales bacterium]
MKPAASTNGLAGLYGPEGSVTADRLARISAALPHRNVAEARVAAPLRGSGIVADASLYNRAELCRELGASGEVSDAELIAQAYLRWGDSCTSHLEGDFAFVLWDAAGQRLFAARDPLGIRPLFYRLDGRTLVWASEVKALAADPDYSPALDEAMLAEFLLGWSDFPDAAATFYHGIRQVPGGHCLTLEGGRLSVRRYWDIDPSDEARYRRPLEENVEEFSALFQHAIRQRLAPTGTGKLGVLVSGGLDSTSIASWVEKRAAENGLARSGLHYLSYFGTEPSGDERAFVQSFQEKYGCPVDFLALDDWWPLERIAREADWKEGPFVDLAWGTTERWSQRLREQGCGVVLTGLGGDNIFPDPGPATLADVVRRYGWRAGWQSLRRTSSYLGMPLAPFVLPTLRQLVPAPAKRALKRWVRKEVPEWMQPDFARRSGVLERVRCEAPRRGFSTVSQELDYAHFATGRLGAVLSYFERVAARHGFEFRHPFFDASLVRFTLLVPPEHKVRDGETKVLLRQAMDGTLPEAVRGRRDKGALDRFFTRWMRLHDRAAWERVAGNAEGAAAFIKPEKAAEMVRRFFDGDDLALKPAWTLLSLVLWLKSFEGRAS